jgi:hypothetical protein
MTAVLRPEQRRRVRHGRVIKLGFEIDGLIEKPGRNVRVLGCLGELQKRNRLKCQVLSAEHDYPRY